MAESKQIKLEKGKVLYAPSDELTSIYYVISGKLTAYCLYGRYIYAQGSIPCLIDTYFGVGLYTYVADEDCVLEEYAANGIKSVSTIIENHSDSASSIVLTSNSILMSMIKTYLTMNMKCRKRDSAYAVDSRIDKWELDRFNGLTAINPAILKSFYDANIAISTSEIIYGARFASTINDANLQMADYLDINLEYVPPAPDVPSDLETVFMLTDDEAGNNEYLNAQIISELTGSFNKILKYSNIPASDIEELQNTMSLYKKGPRAFSDDEIRKIRRQLTEGFYNVYYGAFLRSTRDYDVPIYVTMFLNFGFLDETLLSESSCIELYNIAQDVDNTCNNSYVHTMPNWLSMIMRGIKDPSKNAFDQNYDEFCKENIKSGKLTEKEVTSPEFRVRYEIRNFFMSAHRMTYGHLAGFVPFLTSDQVVRSLKETLTSSDAVIQAINRTRLIDFSLFYRSTAYSNESLGVGKEFIYSEVLPDIVLTPCYGTLGAMWQEIDGRVRTSSARFLLPVFCNGKLDSIILNILGKFRWELCKRIQGAYWNNLAEKSLTAEYFDYLQFYKKNHDLTEANKEKIKSGLTAVHNNFGEFFAKDYEQWIVYESTGINKLNKVVRLIMAKYCPFNKTIRASLASNPIFEQPLAAYDRSIALQKRRIDLTIASLTAKGVDIPREIRETKAYFNK